ncbi:MAG: anaerobic sulfatase maturase, partial [Verrucomicrobiota bacterium]
AGLYPETATHRMSDETLRETVRSYMASPQPVYSFGWQGGEPTLMGVEFFRKVTAYQKKFGFPGCSVSNALQTNGTLIDDELAAHLADYNFLVGVSLDGPEKIHNRYRRSADGSGTHSKALRGIETLRRNKVDFNILTLVSQANVQSPGEIYRYLKGLGFMHHQYIECVEFDRAGELLPYAVNGEQWGDFLCGIFDEWIDGDTRTVSVRLFDSIVYKLVTGISNVCAMGNNCRQYFMVEFNGDVYPCDFFAETGLKLGNVLQNRWQDMADSETYSRFGMRKQQLSEECLECEFLALCQGDCPKNRPGRGSIPQEVSRLCRGWKKFYNHALPEFSRLAEEVKK